VVCAGDRVCGACPGLPSGASGAAPAPSNTSTCMMLCGNAVVPVAPLKCAAAPLVCPVGSYPTPGGDGACTLCAPLACPAGSVRSGCLRGITPPVCSPCNPSLLIEVSAASQKALSGSPLGSSIAG
jgi:hypothetical protein